MQVCGFILVFCLFAQFALTPEIELALTPCQPYMTAHISNPFVWLHRFTSFSFFLSLSPMLSHLPLVVYARVHSRLLRPCSHTCRASSLYVFMNAAVADNSSAPQPGCMGELQKTWKEGKFKTYARWGGVVNVVACIALCLLLLGYVCVCMCVG